MSSSLGSQKRSFTDKFDDFPLAKKLTFGFGIIICFMLIIVAVNYFSALKIAKVEHHISSFLVPMVEAEIELKNGINESLAALRGYMILGSDKFKDKRQDAWANIEDKVSTLDASIHLFPEGMQAEFAEVKSILAEFKEAQQQVEDITFTPGEQPAKKLLEEEAAPRAAEILKAVTAIINEEKTLAATPDRKALLALLADSRGSFAVGLASVRAYLLTGDKAWREDFERRWNVNEQRYQSLLQNQYLFNDKQKAAFSNYQKYRQEFSLLPNQMFDIRESKQWNMANYLLATEAAPRADKVLNILKNITVEINDLLHDDEAALDNLRFWMELISVTLAIIALFVGILAAKFITRRLTSSIQQVKQAVNGIADGELENTIIVSSNDEMGQLLVTIEQMQSRLQQIINHDVQSIIDSARKGDLSERIDVSDKVGCYRELCDGVNELININNKVVNETVDVFSGLAHGNLEVSIDADYQGDFARIKKDANFTVEKLRQIIQSDIQHIINSAAAGNLDGRIALDDKKGFFLELSEKINHLVESNQKVVADTVRVFESMSRGDLSQSITSSYQGDFAKLKNDANVTITKLNDVIERDIQSMVNATLKGDLTQRITMDGKEGFFKTLSESINQLADVFEGIISDASSILGAMAQGDLTSTINTDYQGSYGELKNNINSTIEQLQRVIGEIQQASETVKTGASEIALGVSDLSNRTEQQAVSLEETAASMEQMTRSVENSSGNARQANDLTAIAEQCAVAGGAAVNSAVEAMQGINESSNKIAAIISVIDEIAFQTNLLALNAAVEAARAGEQGRGFAVVAGEVRTLAQRSADAAKEIKDLINDSVGRVENGSKLVNDSGTTLKEIIDSVKQVSVVINDLSVSASQQHEGIQQVNSAVSNMDQMTQQNAALVEESSAASQSMSDQAEKLNQLIDFFSLSQSSIKSAAPTASISNSVVVPSKPASTPAVNSKPATTMTKKPSPASDSTPSAPAPSSFDGDSDGDWEEF